MSKQSESKKTMPVKEAAEVLQEYNKWRRWGDEKYPKKPPDVTEIGIAIDTMIAFARGEIKRDEEAHV